MKRIVKTHQDRKNEILDTAQTLFYKNGYENTSIANVIDAVNIAKGTFYHYFKSKTDLLDQIIDRIANHIDAIIDKVLEEPEENAIVELNNVFQEIGQYKAQEKNILIMMTHALYSDHNIILRTKMTKRRYLTVAPRLAKIISRGKKEGVFNTGNPEYVAELILNMATPLGEKFAEYVMNNQLNEENKEKYLELCSTYDRAVENILGAPEGSLNLFDMGVIEKFFEN
jgi:AcrR family transcriptional regulator